MLVDLRPRKVGNQTIPFFYKGDEVLPRFYISILFSFIWSTKINVFPSLSDIIMVELILVTLI